MTDFTPKDNLITGESGAIFPNISGASNQSNILGILSPVKMLQRRPKRPLSAYNLFFREKRRIILQDIPDVRKESRKSSRARHGKIGFEDLGRTVGAMWKVIEPQERTVYDRLAVEDRKRYDREMDEWETIIRERKGKRHATEKREASSPITIGIDFGIVPRKQETAFRVISNTASAPPLVGSPYTVQSSQHPIFASQVHNVQDKAVTEPLVMHGAVIAAAIKVPKTRHDLAKMTSHTGCLGNTMHPLKFDLLHHSSEDTRKHSSNMELMMVHNVCATNTSINTLDALPTSVHFEKLTVGKSSEESDLFSPTTSSDYSEGYSWLARNMGTANTNFFIASFQG